jgi:hypothetical protein
LSECVQKRLQNDEPSYEVHLLDRALKGSASRFWGFAGALDSGS